MKKRFLALSPELDEMLDQIRLAGVSEQHLPEHVLIALAGALLGARVVEDDGNEPGPEARWAKLLAARTSLRSRLCLVDRVVAVTSGAVRAGGETSCPTCALPYYDHPEHPLVEGVTVLCNGDLVKL